MPECLEVVNQGCLEMVVPGCLEVVMREDFRELELQAAEVAMSQGPW